jgi:hypothetical protein
MEGRKRFLGKTDVEEKRDVKNEMRRSSIR